jgi:hypothetical protein
MAWRNQIITLEEAKNIIATDRHYHDLEHSRGFSFDRQVITDILAQPNCIGIRIYIGQKRDPATELLIDSLVVVGVHGDQNNDPPTDCDDMHSPELLFAEYGYSTHESEPVRDNTSSPFARD